MKVDVDIAVCSCQRYLPVFHSPSYGRRLLVSALFSVLSFGLFSTDYFFFVGFSDKEGSPYSLSRPEEFLSERAIERRQYFRLNCDSTDLPVTPSYLQAVVDNGFSVRGVSKWLNGAVVLTTDSANISGLSSLPFVDRVEYTGKMETATTYKRDRKKLVVQQEEQLASDIYGSGAVQLDMVKGRFLHNAGYRGSGVQIGILDAGFQNVDIMPSLNLMHMQGRLLGTKDFVRSDSDIYAEHAHGAHVLSIMASEESGVFIGTAPEASYWLVRTECDGVEYPMESDFWVLGLEYLDSVGVDVVNSSLGYMAFDEPAMNLTYDDLDGRSTRISRAGSLAVEKGIIVVNSAGNDGQKEWKRIGVPADASGIITVGAVDSEGATAPFSSFGPTADGRVKPELSALGVRTAFMNASGTTSSNGTSFATPVIAGATACLLEAVKSQMSYIRLDDLLQLFFETCDQYDTPTDQRGYGIPDFEKALLGLPIASQWEMQQADRVFVFTDSLAGTLRIDVGEVVAGSVYVRIYSLVGDKVVAQSFMGKELVVDTNGFAPGMYAVQVVFSTGKTVTQKVLIY